MSRPANQSSEGLGADLSYTTGNLDGCSPPGGGGAHLTATWINISYGRFGAGLHAGRGVSDLTDIDAEIGYSRATAHNGLAGVHDLHMGVNGLALLLFPVSLSGTIPLFSDGQLPDVTASLGASFPGMLGRIGCGVTEGRPLRVNGQYLLPDVAVCSPDLESGLQRGRLAAGHARNTSQWLPPITRIDDPDLRGTIVSRWVEAGRGEFASIPAFLVLAEDLALVGAPAPLIHRAFEAVADEHRHAELCFGMSADYAGMAFSPTVSMPLAHPVVLARQATVKMMCSNTRLSVIGIHLGMSERSIYRLQTQPTDFEPTSAQIIL